MHPIYVLNLYNSERVVIISPRISDLEAISTIYVVYCFDVFRSTRILERVGRWGGGGGGV